MTDDVLHFRECEACGKRHPQDAMRQCKCGAWLHQDCPCVDQWDCIEAYNAAHPVQCGCGRNDGCDLEPPEHRR